MLNPSLRRRHTSWPHWDLLYKITFSWQALKLVPRFKTANFKLLSSFLYNQVYHPTSHPHLLFPSNPEVPKVTTGYLRFTPTPKETPAAKRIPPRWKTCHLTLACSGTHNDQNKVWPEGLTFFGKEQHIVLGRSSAITLLSSECLYMVPQQIPYVPNGN